MVYKSKKINKRRYRRQSRKLMKKRMYGGDGENSAILPLPPQEKDKMDIDMQAPSPSENIQNAASTVVDGLSALTLDAAKSLAEKVGIDPNMSPGEIADETISKTGEFFNAINKAFSSEKGKRILEDASNVGKKLVTTLKPAADETLNTMNDLVKKEIPILTDMGEKLVLGLPGIGTAVAAGEEVIDATAATATAAATLAELSETGSKTLVDLNKQKSNVKSIIERSKEVVSDAYNNLNKGVGDVISAGKEQVDKYNERVNENIPKQKVGGSLKKYQKERMMIGGRISQSQSEFLDGQLNSLQKLHQNGGKWNTKRRHYLKHKMSSRSYK